MHADSALVAGAAPETGQGLADESVSGLSKALQRNKKSVARKAAQKKAPIPRNNADPKRDPVEGEEPTLGIVLELKSCTTPQPTVDSRYKRRLGGILRVAYIK